MIRTYQCKLCVILKCRMKSAVVAFLALLVPQVSRLVVPISFAMDLD